MTARVSFKTRGGFDDLLRRGGSANFSALPPRLIRGDVFWCGSGPMLRRRRPDGWRLSWGWRRVSWVGDPGLAVGRVRRAGCGGDGGGGGAVCGGLTLRRRVAGAVPVLRRWLKRLRRRGRPWWIRWWWRLIAVRLQLVPSNVFAERRRRLPPAGKSRCG